MFNLLVKTSLTHLKLTHKLSLLLHKIELAILYVIKSFFGNRMKLRFLLVELCPKLLILSNNFVYLSFKFPTVIKILFYLTFVRCFSFITLKSDSSNSVSLSRFSCPLYRFYFLKLIILILLQLFLLIKFIL